IVGEKRTIYRAVLQTFENFACLRKLFWSSRIITGEQQRSNARGNRSRTSEASWFVSTTTAARSSGNTRFSDVKPETSPPCDNERWPSLALTSTPSAYC